MPLLVEGVNPLKGYVLRVLVGICWRIAVGTIQKHEAICGDVQTRLRLAVLVSSTVT